MPKKKRKPGYKSKSAIKLKDANHLTQKESDLLSAMKQSLTNARSQIEKPKKQDKTTEEGLRKIIENDHQLFENIRCFIILLNNKDLSATNLTKTTEFLKDYQEFLLWFGQLLSKKNRTYERLVNELIKYTIFLVKTLSYHAVFSQSPDGKNFIDQFGVLHRLDKTFTLPHTEMMAEQLKNRKKKSLSNKFSEEFLTTTFNGVTYAAIDETLMESFSDTLADYGFNIMKETKPDDDSDRTPYETLFMTYTGESVPKSVIHRDHLNAYVHVLNDAVLHTELLSLCRHYFEEWHDEKCAGSDTTHFKVQLIDDQATVVETLFFKLDDLFIIKKANRDGTRNIEHTVLLRTLLYNNLPNLGLLPCYTNTGKNKKKFTEFIKEQPHFSQFFNFIKKKFKVDFTSLWARRGYLFSVEVNNGTEILQYDLAKFLSDYAAISEHLIFLKFFTDHIHQIFHSKVNQSRTPMISPDTSSAFDLDDMSDEKYEPIESSASDIARTNQILLRNLFTTINGRLTNWATDQQAVLDFARDNRPDDVSEFLQEMRNSPEKYLNDINDILEHSNFLNDVNFSLDIENSDEKQHASENDLVTPEGGQSRRVSSSSHTFFSVNIPIENTAEGNITITDPNVLSPSRNYGNINS